MIGIKSELSRKSCRAHSSRMHSTPPVCSMHIKTKQESLSITKILHRHLRNFMILLSKISYLENCKKHINVVNTHL